MGISKKKLKQSYKYISKNKYWLTASIFFIWMTFMDTNNLFHLIKQHKQITDLSKEETYYKTKIKTDSTRIKELNTNKKSLEKFAREQYFFHKPNEIVFKIKTTKK
jgi:cell division protein FtsB